MNSLDEIFGPVFTMISASSDEEIIKIANDSKVKKYIKFIF